MTLNTLAEALKDMYQNAKSGERVTMIYVFGIRYAEHIKSVGVKAVIEQSQMRPSYATELAKAVKLAKYVTEK